MGVDFIRKAAHSFHKGLDWRRIELGTPDLFTQQAVSAPRTYAASLCDNENVSVGERLGVRFDGEGVCALRGLDPVATFDHPPNELVEALAASHGEACGTVQQVHPMARTAEISLW